jgi:serine phosphatase RsbU (regulator of sigma subunit)
MRGAEYDEVVVPLHVGDSILFFTDGAVEITAANGELIGTDGLRHILEEIHYPSTASPFEEIETRLLAASNLIRFDDDLTFLDVQIREIGGDTH